jgi:hypothetical protein
LLHSLVSIVLSSFAHPKFWSISKLDLCSEAKGDIKALDSGLLKEVKLPVKTEGNSRHRRGIWMFAVGVVAC